MFQLKVNVNTRLGQSPSCPPPNDATEAKQGQSTKVSSDSQRLVVKLKTAIPAYNFYNFK